MEEVTVSWLLPRAVLVRAAVTGVGLSMSLPFLFCLGYFESVGIGTGLCAAATALFWLPSALTLIPLLVNATTVSFGEDRIAVSHGPLPWPQGPELGRGEILSFEVMPSGAALVLIPALALVENRWARQTGFGDRYRTQMTSEALDAGGGWSVEAVLVGGTLEPIASGMRTKEEAVALRDRLTAWLGRPETPPDDLSLFSPHA